jgi:hypothetical protein
MSEGSRLSAVDTFAVGTHRGKGYDRDDLKNIELNFRDFSTGPRPILRVPGVLGHEEDQEYLNRSDLPAASWVTNVRSSPDGHLRTDHDEVPDKVARLIKGHRYRTVSAEIYDAVPEGVGTREQILAILKKRGINPDQALAEAQKWAPVEHRRQQEEVASGQRERALPVEVLVDRHLRSHLGKMLRRVAFLGADIPQIKNLDDIPMPESHAEQDERFARLVPARVVLRDVQPTKDPNLFVCFSELQTMAGENDTTATVDQVGAGDLMQQLADKGADTAVLEGLNPEQLAEVLRLCDSGDNPQEYDDDTAPMSTIDGYAEDENLPEPANDDERKAFAERAMKMGGRAQKFAARSMRFMDKYCDMGANKNSDTATRLDTMSLVKPTVHDDKPAGDTRMPAQTTITHKYTEQEVEAIAKIVGDRLEAKIKPVEAKVAQLDKFAEDKIAADTRARIDSELQALVGSGQVLPSQIDAGQFQYLYDLPATGNLEKFSESGKAKTGSKLDAALARLKGGPILRKYGEKLRDPADKAGVEGEVAKVEAHFESFSEDFQKCGTTKEELVGAFKNRAKREPGLTAERFLGNSKASA